MFCNGLYDESSSLSWPAFNKDFSTCFSGYGNTPAENELYTVWVNVVLIGSETILELILRMINGSFAQFVLLTMGTMKRVVSWLLSAKFVSDKIEKFVNKLAF